MKKKENKKEKNELFDPEDETVRMFKLYTLQPPRPVRSRKKVTSK